MEEEGFGEERGYPLLRSQSSSAATMASTALTFSFHSTPFLSKSLPSIKSQLSISHFIPRSTAPICRLSPISSLNPAPTPTQFLSPKPPPPSTTTTSSKFKLSATAEAQQEPYQGATLKPLVATILTAVALWFLPSPAGISRTAWQLLAIFLATIVGIITQPLPFGAVALAALGATILTKTLPFSAAFSAFSDPIPWLIALAFFFARGFIKTGLGNRVAYHFVRLFGRTSLGLCYSLVLSEALLAPAIPSVSARAGGVMLPVIKALCAACGSNAGDGTEKKLGSWLVLTCFHTSVCSSAMFLTATAANPLTAKLVSSTINRSIGWVEWATAAIVPGLVAMMVIPAVLYVIYSPEVKSSPDAPRLAAERLEKMGPLSRDEIIMLFSLLLTVCFV
ncbi:hypothetical protein Cgig2_002281 [Carnegiea gigantea]|uniref:Sodium/sulfate symporter n=1 Tax=Carnegiea gigantea TaxID=171969 RepID=A0A9Q1KV61_9CARY|nr:hypothetical protein Cgig2_002281 [Carnegiea gigantea]